MKIKIYIENILYKKKWVKFFFLLYLNIRIHLMINDKLNNFNYKCFFYFIHN